MIAPPILYSFRRCPYAMRARMALLASGTVHEIREVKLADKPPALIAASPKATVPVLLLPDGRVIDESIDIMRWALARHDPLGWLSHEAEAARLIAINDGAFKHHLDHYKYPDRHNADAAAHYNDALAILTDLERCLATNRYLCGPAPVLADHAIMPFVRQFAAVDPASLAARPLPRLHAWLIGLTGSDMFVRAMIRRPAWREGDVPVYIDPNDTEPATIATASGR